MKKFLVIFSILSLMVLPSVVLSDTGTTGTGNANDKPGWISNNSHSKIMNHDHSVTHPNFPSQDSFKNLNPLEVGVGIDVGVNQVLEKTEKIPVVGKILKPVGFLEHLNFEGRKDTLEAERGSVYLVLDLTELKKKK